jgi:hypothetical protein
LSEIKLPGVFFEMITTDMRRHPPETLDELIKLDYTLYTIPKGLFGDEPFDFAVRMLQNFKGLVINVFYLIGYQEL